MTRSALLVIDVQDSFLQQPRWAATSNPGIVGQVSQLVDAARAQDDRVIWVLHTEPGTGSSFDPASGHVRLMSGLVPHDGEAVLSKTSINAFTTTNLQRLLVGDRITEVTICGIRTEQCCETTARVASDLGYGVTFVTEATATTPIEHRDVPPGRSLADMLADPDTLQVAEIIERTEYVLAGRFARIATVAELTGTPAIAAG